jgi:four helix bundle protein
MSNIAEGFDSETQALFISYLSRARASASEARSQLYIAFDLGYLSKNEFEETKKMVVECSRQLFGFISYLRDQPNARRISDKESPRYVIDYP